MSSRWAAAASCSMASASSGVRAIAFSTRTCLPAFSAPRHVGVQVGRRTNVDKVHVGIGEQVFEALVALHAAEVHLLAGGAEVAADAAPVAGPFLRIAAAHGRHAGAGRLARGEEVDHAHETKTYYADADHWRILLSFRALRISRDSTDPMKFWPISPVLRPTFVPILCAPGAVKLYFRGIMRVWEASGRWSLAGLRLWSSPRRACRLQGRKRVDGCPATGKASQGPGGRQ